jgi:hypothetical protein
MDSDDCAFALVARLMVAKSTAAAVFVTKAIVMMGPPSVTQRYSRAICEFGFITYLV